MTRTVLIAGAGPAGLTAAIAAARKGARVILFEKMSSPGRKLLITGSGKCNLTNTADMDDFISKYFGQGRFLYPAFHAFFRPELLELMKQGNLRMVTEANGKLFPSTGKASDVLTVLLTELGRLHVDLRIGQSILGCVTERSNVTGLQTTNGVQAADAVILATGGCSYPGTGSSGDGFRWARETGHTVTDLRPALVPMVVNDSRLTQHRGISLPDCNAELLQSGKRLAQDRGELLITHFGLSGPVILRLSRYLTATANAELPPATQIRLDLLPQHSQKELHSLWQTGIRQKPRQQIVNALAGTLPARLLHVLIERAGMDPAARADQLSHERLQALVHQAKSLELQIAGTRGFKEAMVTAGGVSISQINPRSMESRLVRGLYFAGEMIDIDGDTGGYNLQAAFSTGFLAGCCAASD